MMTPEREGGKMKMTKQKLRSRYEYAPRFGSQHHTWIVTGALGAIHLHISGPHHYDGQDHWSVGLETHYRSPPDYMANYAPSHDQCWVLKGPCWHDGTPLYAEERYLSWWQVEPNDHDAMFRRLEHEYVRRFMEKDDANVDG